MDERERYKEIIEENIEYEIMKDRPDGDRLGEIVEIMLDAVCSTAPTIRINGEDMPQQVVKSRFLKLDSSHIEYVFHAMNNCPSDIRNIRAYLLTTLYNAPATMDNFYSATRSNNNSYGLNYQKTGKELMSQDEIAVMDGAKCILQLRGVRPFLSNKYDITKHPKYRRLSDYDKRNTFDIEKYRQHKLVVKPDDTFDLYDMGEVDAD